LRTPNRRASAQRVAVPRRNGFRAMLSAKMSS
jgi:hypothetical protein